MEFIHSTFDAILARSAEDLIGAILVALMLSMAIAGVYALARRKVSDAFMLNVGLMLFANVVSMTLAVGYIAYRHREVSNRKKQINPPAWGPHSDAFRMGNLPQVPGSPRRSPGSFGPISSLTQGILEAADTDKDNRLSAKEASEAAAQFVRHEDINEKGSIDAEVLSQAIIWRMRSPFGMGPLGPAGKLGPEVSRVPPFGVGPLGPAGKAGPEVSRVPQLFDAADADKDGRLSPDEAALFVRKADTSGNGSADAAEIDIALKNRPEKPPVAGESPRAAEPARVETKGQPTP